MAEIEFMVKASSISRLNPQQSINWIKIYCSILGGFFFFLQIGSKSWKYVA